MKTHSVALSLKNHILQLKAKRPSLPKNNMGLGEWRVRGCDCHRADCSYSCLTFASVWIGLRADSLKICSDPYLWARGET